MPLARKPFAEFAAELAAGLRAGRGDEPIAESARFKVIEVAPRFRGRFRGRLAAERTCIGASAKFCEPCKKCLRHNAFYEKSQQCLITVKTVAPGFPRPGGSVFGGCVCSFLATRKRFRLRPRHSRACASHTDYDVERFGMCHSGTTDACE